MDHNSYFHVINIILNACHPWIACENIPFVEKVIFEGEFYQKEERQHEARYEAYHNKDDLDLDETFNKFVHVNEPEKQKLLLDAPGHLMNFIQKCCYFFIENQRWHQSHVVNGVWNWAASRGLCEADGKYRHQSIDGWLHWRHASTIQAPSRST